MTFAARVLADKKKRSDFRPGVEKFRCVIFHFFTFHFLFVLLEDFLFPALGNTLTRSSVASEVIPPCYFLIFLSKASRQKQRCKALPPAASNVSE